MSVGLTGGSMLPPCRLAHLFCLPIPTAQHIQYLLLLCYGHNPFWWPITHTSYRGRERDQGGRYKGLGPGTIHCDNNTCGGGLRLAPRHTKTPQVVTSVKMADGLRPAPDSNGKKSPFWTYFRVLLGPPRVLDRYFCPFFSA